MKLYYSKGACSLAVRITLHEMDVPCEFELVNLSTKKMETGEDFLKINPKGSVPALLLDSGELLTENAVIQQYLADHYHADTLLPPVGVLQRYRVLEWLNFASTDLHKSFSPLFNSKVDASVKEAIFIPVLKTKLDYLNNHLAKHTYLAGDKYTLPDSYVFVTLRWLKAFHINLSDWTHLERYFNLLKARPSFEQALAEEGLS